MYNSFLTEVEQGIVSGWWVVHWLEIVGGGCLKLLLFQLHLPKHAY